MLCNLLHQLLFIEAYLWRCSCSYLTTITYHVFIKRAVCLSQLLGMMLHLIEAADELNMSVTFWEVNQVQILLQLLSFLCLNLPFHVDHGQVPVLLHLSILPLITFQDDFMLPIDHFSPMHLMVELIRVPQLGLQSQLPDDLVFQFEVITAALVVFALLEDAQVLSVA